MANADPQEQLMARYFALVEAHGLNSKEVRAFEVSHQSFPEAKALFGTVRDLEVKGRAARNKGLAQRCLAVLAALCLLVILPALAFRHGAAQVENLVPNTEAELKRLLLATGVTSHSHREETPNRLAQDLYQWTIEKERDFQNRSAALHQNLERAMGENQSLRDELAKLRGERLSVDKLLAEAQAGREQADKDLQTARAGNRQLNALLVAQQTRMLIVQLSEFRNQPRTAWAERLTPLIPAGPAEGEGGHYLRAMWLDFQGDGNHYADALRSVPANDPWAKLAQVELAGLAGNPTPMIEWLAQVEGDLRGARPAQPQNLDLQLAKRLVCQQAAVRLHQQGRPILPALFHALQSNQLTTRLASLATLSLLGPEATPAVNTVMGFLHDDAPPELAAQSAYFLGQVGPGAARAMEALARLAQHGSPEVRDAANKAMAAIQGRR